MTYFKITKDENVISVGCVFLKWNTKRHKFNVCDVNEGQFVQTYDEKGIYKASWLKPAPKEAGEYETVKVTVIDEVEYDTVKTLIDEGEEIEEVVTEPIVELIEQQEPAQEKPLTIAQMRELIAEQQKQIDMLLEKLK